MPQACIHTVKMQHDGEFNHELWVRCGDVKFVLIELPRAFGCSTGRLHAYQTHRVHARWHGALPSRCPHQPESCVRSCMLCMRQHTVVHVPLGCYSPAALERRDTHN